MIECAAHGDALAALLLVVVSTPRPRPGKAMASEVSDIVVCSYDLAGDGEALVA